MILTRILILEDDEDVVSFIKSILEPPFECYKATNGAEGLQMTIQGQPDLILCDLMLPILDGKEFIKRLRHLPGYEKTPVIILSALSSRDQIRDGYEVGGDLYLTKPIDPTRLKRNIEMFIVDHKIVPKMKRVAIDQLCGSRPAPPPPIDLAKGTETKPRPAPEPVGGVGGEADDTISEQTTAETVVKSGGLAWMQQARRLGQERIRIMVVEDDSDACEMIRAGLKDHFDVVDAEDGIVAIERAMRYKPDLFIIDGMLPRMTGYQLTMMLKKNKNFYQTPIIFISGKATPRDQQYVARLGINHFLAKPFTVQELLAVVGSVVNSPGFSVHQDRVQTDQIYLEQFQELETHRKGRRPTIDQLERDGIGKVLKRQIQKP